MSLSKYPEKAFLEAIGKNIKAYRVKKGLTLEQLGEDIGTDKSNMLRIEQGKNITLLTSGAAHSGQDHLFNDHGRHRKVCDPQKRQEARKKWREVVHYI